MQHVKMKKLIIHLIVFLLAIFIASALDECKTEVDVDEVPCELLLPINVSITDCNTINLTIFSNATQVESQFMNQKTTFICAGNFSQKTIGSYTFSYSNGDSGSLTVTEGIILELLLYFVLAFALVLLGFAIWREDTNFAIYSGFIFMVLGIFMFTEGFSTLSNFITKSISFIFIGLGIYLVWRASIENIDEGFTTI